ncbi:MAG: hypothetical protein [Bacteriophage sp.]|nr:MAG: hypothetical protein [Bacteriophage sp.]
MKIINNNFASTIIGTVSGRISYNGRTINVPQSSHMELVDGQILIDGKPFEQYNEEDFPIIKIELTGNVESIKTGSGDVIINGDAHNIRTMSGDVRCKTIEGSVSTMSGDVTCDNIKGNCSTMNGDIRR